MSPLRVLLLSDGRPGHFHLSEGIVAAMARLRPVVVERLEVRRSRLVSGRLAAGALAAGVPPQAVLRMAHGLGPGDIPAADIIVSAGAETMPASVALARLRGIPNVFYGSLRSYRPGWFALSLTSYAEDAREPHPVMTLKPGRLDPDTLPALPPAVRGEYRPPGAAGLLIGGNGGGTVFRDADWDGLAGMLETTHASWGTRWLVSNSRRTPGAVGDRLAALAAREGGPIARFIDVRTAGAGTLTELLAASEAVAVTADSSSMLSEAVWSRRPTLSLAPRTHTMTTGEAGYRRVLEHMGCCRAISIAEATPAHLIAALSTIVTLPRNPLDDLAAVLARALPLLRAPSRR